MTEAAVAVSDLRCELGRQPVLEGINLSLHGGEFLSVIGPNGAGKTTLLKCINRIVPHRGGNIEILGRPLDAYRQRDLAKVLSYVPQADARYFPFLVREFVLMGRYPHLSPFTSIAERDRRAADAALDRTATLAFADRPMDTLSGGERQRVFIAASLAQGARILLLDEPATFLDYKHQVEVLGLMQRLHREEGVTILSVTHDVNSAVLTSDRVLALKDGRSFFCGTPDDLLAGNVLEDLYETPFERLPSGVDSTVVVRPTGTPS